jgi:hypothetical protein
LTTPYVSPSATQPAVRPRRRPSVVGPLILILVGCVFLLENAGVLPRNTWQSLWRLWPVVLVLVGLELLVGQRVPWITLLGLALVIFTLGIGATAYPAIRGEQQRATNAIPGRTMDVDLGAATQADVTVRFGAGELNIGPMAGAPPGRLASMTYDGPESENLRPSYSVQGETGRLEFRLDGWRTNQGMPPFMGDFDHASMQIDLNPAVPITSLNVQGGAADAELDLRELRVNNLDVQVGAAATEIRLPQTGVSNVHISGGASTITIDVPDGVAARITHRGGLSTLDVDESRFPSIGNNRYQSPDFEQATNKADITLETGVTSIEID